MSEAEAIQLIQHGVSKHTQQQTWADLGAGNGVFTSALSTLLWKGSTAFAIDRNQRDLDKISLTNHEVVLKKITMDFSHADLLPPNLNGILMANALHYIREKKTLLEGLANKLTMNGTIIIIEYELIRANPWVPYPIRFEELRALMNETGFGDVSKLGERPSTLNRSLMYSAAARREAALN